MGFILASWPLSVNALSFGVDDNSRGGICRSLDIVLVQADMCARNVLLQSLHKELTFLSSVGRLTVKVNLMSIMPMMTAIMRNNQQEMCFFITIFVVENF